MTGLISIVAGTLHLPAAAVTFRPAPIDIAAAGALILVTATLIVTGLWRSAGAGRRRRGQERAALRALDEELDALLADVRQAMNQRDKDRSDERRVLRATEYGAGIQAAGREDAGGKYCG